MDIVAAIRKTKSMELSKFSSTSPEDPIDENDSLEKKQILISFADLEGIKFSHLPKTLREDCQKGLIHNLENSILHPLRAPHYSPKNMTDW